MDGLLPKNEYKFKNLEKEEYESGNVFYRGGVTRSSDEVVVMTMEQRGNIILLDTENN